MDFHIELVHLKRELLKEITKLDTKFTNLYQKESSNITEDTLTPLDKINIMLKKTEQMFHSITEQQLKLDKIAELEIFKNRTNDTIIAHDIRIKNLNKDLEDVKFKYDREITQNLMLPGFIGASCRFKTISEYLLFNIDDITKLKMEKELMKKEEKELKTKLDSMLKNTLNLVDNSVARSYLYTDNKQKDIENELNNKYKEFNDKIMEMKAATLSNEKFVKEELVKITKLASDLNYLNENVEAVLDKKLSELKLIINELKNKVDKINNEVKKNHKNIDNINNMIKTSGIFNNINKDDKNKYNQTKRSSIMKKADINNYNYKIKNNDAKKNYQEERNFTKESINSRNQKNSNSFKKIQNREINNYMNQKIIEKNNINDYFQKLENRKETNDKSNNNDNIINQNNIRTQNELKYKIKPKYLEKKVQKINIHNGKDKIESYSLEDKLSSDRKMIDLEKNLEKEINKEKNIEINEKINLSDGEREKKNLKIIKKNKHFQNKKINKYKLIKIDRNKSNENNKKEDNIKNLIIHTDYNFYNKKDLNDFHYYKDEIVNLKRYQFHKIFKNENSEESSKKANSDINLDINIDDNSSNKLQTSQKINTIYYPNKEMITNLKHKEVSIKPFLNRHYNSINKSDAKLQKNSLNEENKKMIETTPNFYNHNEFKNNSNIFDTINSPPPLLKENEYYLNRKDSEIQSDINMKNNKNPEKLNFKFISLDNQFKMALNKKKLQFRNEPEIFLRTPITKVFKTFQIKKSKDMFNNIKNKKIYSYFN